jgi:ribosomal protein S18 acetylase RimI-like enzyme
MIRPMAKYDRARVLDIINKTGFFRPDEIRVAEELIDIYLDQPGQKDYEVVVIEDEKPEVVGYLTYGLTSLTVGTYDLYWMAVAPEHQGKGYGKDLVRWLEEKIRADRGRMMVIETSSQPKYEPTRRFYLNLDYQEIARIPDFYGPGDDRVIYIKRFA